MITCGIFGIRLYTIPFFFCIFAIICGGATDVPRMMKQAEIRIGTEENTQQYMEGDALRLAWRADTLLDVPGL